MHHRFRYKIFDNCCSYLNLIKEEYFLKNLKPLFEYSEVIVEGDLGRGVVSLVDIPKGTLLGVYPGKYLTIDQFLEKETFVSRSIKSTFKFSENVVIDPTDIFGFLPNKPQLRIAFINEPPPGFQANVMVLSSSKYIWYLSCLDIKKGQQIFTNYGNTYRRDYKTEESCFKCTDTIAESLKDSVSKFPWLSQEINVLVNPKNYQVEA